MMIALTPEQEAWIQAYAATGAFASIEAAARQLIDERIEAHPLDAHDDLAWARDEVNEGLAALDRGEFITLAEHKARNAARLAALPG